MISELCALGMGTIVGGMGFDALLSSGLYPGEYTASIILLIFLLEGTRGIIFMDYWSNYHLRSLNCVQEISVLISGVEFGFIIPGIFFLI
jgi:hypothetical protein